MHRPHTITLRGPYVLPGRGPIDQSKEDAEVEAFPIAGVSSVKTPDGGLLLVALPQLPELRGPATLIAICPSADGGEVLVCGV